MNNKKVTFQENYKENTTPADEEIKLDKQPFASALQRAAKKKGLTQDALAEKIHKSKNTVAQMFTGQRFTSVPTLVSLCRELGVTPDFLLGAYLSNGDNIKEDEYHRLLKSISELKPNEIYILYGIIELLKNNRDKR